MRGRWHVCYGSGLSIIIIITKRIFSDNWCQALVVIVQMDLTVDGT